MQGAGRSLYIVCCFHRKFGITGIKIAPRKLSKWAFIQAILPENNILVILFHEVTNNSFCYKSAKTLQKRTILNLPLLINFFFCSQETQIWSIDFPTFPFEHSHNNNKTMAVNHASEERLLYFRFFHLFILPQVPCAKCFVSQWHAGLLLWTVRHTENQVANRKEVFCFINFWCPSGDYQHVEAINRSTW